MVQVSLQHRVGQSEPARDCLLMGLNVSPTGEGPTMGSLSSTTSCFAVLTVFQCITMAVTDLLTVQGMSVVESQAQPTPEAEVRDPEPGRPQSRPNMAPGEPAKAPSLTSRPV